MRYSLLNRFHGGLLGSRIGEWVGSDRLKDGDISPLRDWRNLEIAYAERLIETGKLPSIEELDAIASHSCSLLDLKQMGNSSEVAIALFPIIVYFHDNFNLLEKQLQQAATLWLDPTHSLEDILAWGYAIAFALKEFLTPQALIPLVLQRLDKRETPLAQQLIQVQQLLIQEATLSQVLSQLTHQPNSTSTPLALALYCFATTAEDFQLCLLRAAQASKSPHLTTALAGAIAGVYNSYIGIDIQWRLANPSDPLHSKTAFLAHQLFATWSGVYQPHAIPPLLHQAAVASARGIQPRPSLRIISQEKYKESPQNGMK